MSTHTTTRSARIRNVVTMAAIGVALGAAYAVLPGHAPTTAPLPPCPTEDSVGCYWDAHGTGRSYTVDADGTVHYWDGCMALAAYDAQGRELPILARDCVPRN